MADHAEEFVGVLHGRLDELGRLVVPLTWLFKLLRPVDGRSVYSCYWSYPGMHYRSHDDSQCVLESAGEIEVSFSS